MFGNWASCTVMWCAAPDLAVFFAVVGLTGLRDVEPSRSPEMLRAKAECQALARSLCSTMWCHSLLFHYLFFFPVFVVWLRLGARRQLWVGCFCHLGLCRWHLHRLNYRCHCHVVKCAMTSSSSSSSSCIFSIFHNYPSLLCFVSLSQSCTLSLWRKRIIHASQQQLT